MMWSRPDSPRVAYFPGLSPTRSRRERPEPLPIPQEPHNRVPTSHRWGHRDQRARLRSGFFYRRVQPGKGDGGHYCSRQPEDNTNFRLVFGSDVGTRDRREMTSDDSHRLRPRSSACYVSDGLQSGALKPIVARTFPLDDINDAHRYAESNQHIGKIVVLTQLDQLSDVAGNTSPSSDTAALNAAVRESLPLSDRSIDGQIFPDCVKPAGGGLGARWMAHPIRLKVIHARDSLRSHQSRKPGR